MLHVLSLSPNTGMWGSILTNTTASIGASYEGSFPVGHINEISELLKRINIVIPSMTIDIFIRDLKEKNIEISSSYIDDDNVIIHLAKDNSPLSFEDMRDVLENVVPDLILEEGDIVIA